MNRVWRQLAIATNWPVLVATLVLSSLGIISIWAYNPSLGQKQLLFCAVAAAFLISLQAINYLLLVRWAWTLYLLSLALVLYTVLGWLHALPLVHPTKGASCWIAISSAQSGSLVSFEPTELMKLSYVLVMARYLRFRSNYRTLIGLLPPFALTLIPMALILKQPDLGVAALFVPTLLALLFVAGARIKHLLIIFGVGILIVPPLWLAGRPDVPFFRHLPALVRPYQRTRVLSMFSSDARTNQDSGEQQLRAMEAIGSGGLFGKGLGVVPIGKRIPEAHNDMVYALVAEQFGLLGSLAVLAAYIVLFAAGVEIAAATREPFGKLVAVGIVCFLAAQAFLNLMVVMRLFPVTGVTLPFVSYGGSSLVASFIASGLLLNIGQNRPLVIARDSFEFD